MYNTKVTKKGDLVPDHAGHLSCKKHFNTIKQLGKEVVKCNQELSDERNSHQLCCLTLKYYPMSPGFSLSVWYCLFSC